MYVEAMLSHNTGWKDLKETNSEFRVFFFLFMLLIRLKMNADTLGFKRIKIADRVHCPISGIVTECNYGIR